jgi:hypothetical protein
MKTIITEIWCILVLAVSASAANYTVKSDGSGNYTTIQSCATAISPGDTCTVYAGTYNEKVTIPAGTTGNLKTVKANGSDIITLTGPVTLNSHTELLGNCPELQGSVVTATCGFFITNPSSPTTSCVDFASNSTDAHLIDNTMYACGSINEPQNNSVVTFSEIRGNTITYPCSTSSAPNVCLAIYVTGNYQLIANNDLSNDSDGFNMLGSHNIVRGNIMHDSPSTNCGGNSSNCHIDFIQSEPNYGSTLNPATEFNVIDHNTEVNNTSSNGHGYLTQGDYCSGNCFNTIIRFNKGAHVGGGGLLDDAGSFYNVKTYNNTWADYTAALFSSGNLTLHWKSNSYGGSAINSIFYYPGSATNFNPVGCEDTSCSPFNYGHDIAFCVGGCGTSGSGLLGHVYGSGTWTGDPGNLYADPQFTSYSTTGIGNLSLQSTSPARNAGTYLTTVNGSISSSTTLVVADADYFQDGYTIPGVKADCISVTTISNHVCITAVNYSTNTLTLASPITATIGDPVWIYSISDGTVVLTDSTGPDLGAVPYSSSSSSAPSAPTGLAAVVN